MAIPTNVAGTTAAARKGRTKAAKATGKAAANGEAPAGEPVAPVVVTPKAQARPAKAAKLETARRREALEGARLLKMAADPTRLQILLILADGTRNVGEMCGDLGGIGQPAASHHIALMRHSGLISASRVGKNNYYSLNEKGRRLVAGIRAVVGGGAGEG